jgi:hypothetical protein
LKIKPNYVYYRCRDDIFFTWNGSKDQVQTYLNQILINEQQHPSIQPLMTKIGTKIHLLDLELKHDKKGDVGHLFTKIYRDPKTDEFELPDKFEYYTCQPSNLFKAALKHAVQCCSNEEDFHDERRHLELSYLIRGFSLNFIHKCIDEFYDEVGIKTVTYRLVPIIPYQALRQHVLNNYEQKLTMKKQQENEKQKIIRIRYPDHLDAQMVDNIKNDLLNILKESAINKEVFKNAQFELVPRPQTPLTMNDYLVDKRPPLCMLTLSSNNESD